MGKPYTVFVDFDVDPPGKLEDGSVSPYVVALWTVDPTDLKLLRIYKRRRAFAELRQLVTGKKIKYRGRQRMYHE